MIGLEAGLVTGPPSSNKDRYSPPCFLLLSHDVESTFYLLEIRQNGVQKVGGYSIFENVKQMVCTTVQGDKETGRHRGKERKQVKIVCSDLLIKL